MHNIVGHHNRSDELSLNVNRASVQPLVELAGGSVERALDVDEASPSQSAPGLVAGGWGS